MKAICTIIKNEHLFLEEWILWHLNLGFNYIHLFEDKGSDSHEDICKKYSNVYLRRYENDEEVQELLKNQGSSHRQFVLYQWFAENYKDKYDWCAFIDIDEFIMFADGYNLDKLCEEFESYPAVLLNWKMKGASGHIKRPNCGVIEAYTEDCNFCGLDRIWAYKSFVNLNKYIGFENLHVSKGAVNTNHNTHIHEYYYDKAWLNHYFTKSWEDWCDRIFNRGGTLNGHRGLTLFFECNENMKYAMDELLYSVDGRIPKSTYWLDRNKCLIAGGNIKIINEINKNLKRVS